MKPCQKYKERIALAIMDDQVDRHVSECAACAAYAKEVKRIYGEHRARAEALLEIEAPERLHARVRDSITLHECVACCGIDASLRRLLQGLGVAATAVIILALVLNRAPHDAEPASAAVAVTKPDLIGEPTFAAYHNRLSRSVEEFEASLKDHGSLNASEVLKISSASQHLP